MNEPKPVIRDVVAMLAQRHPREFADFWATPEDQQSELIKRYGTDSDCGLWDKRNAEGALMLKGRKLRKNWLFGSPRRSMSTRTV
jgi:hypothetical protein